MLTSVCNARAVRFIGTQRPSIAIENDVSTSSATQACVRASVSCTSTSSMRSWTRGLDDRSLRSLLDHRWSLLDHRGSSPAPPASRSTALVTVRVTSQGSVSPNAQARVEPDGSPAAPAWRTSRWPWRPLIRSATSRSSDLPSWRIAFGESRRSPSVPRRR